MIAVQVTLCLTDVLGVAVALYYLGKKDPHSPDAGARGCRTDFQSVRPEAGTDFQSVRA